MQTIYIINISVLSILVFLLAIKTNKNHADKDPVDNELIEKLKSVIEAEKPYLEEKLTIAELSGQTGIPQKQLSQVLNNRYNQNFFDYINTLRVEEVNRRIKKGDNRQLPSCRSPMNADSALSRHLTGPIKSTWECHLPPLPKVAPLHHTT